MKFKNIASWSALGILTAIAIGGATFMIRYQSPVEVAKRNVVSLLKDPTSPIFSEVMPCKNSRFFVYGYINAKNDYGAYSGRKFFITEFIEGSPFTSIEEAEFDKWNIANWYSKVVLDNVAKHIPCGRLLLMAETEQKTTAEGMSAAVADIDTSAILAKMNE